MKKNLVSIIVPAYNAEKYIGCCLDSILNQSYKEIEIIVVNDGSKDGTKAVVEDYCKRNSGIVLVNIQNKGVSSARNVGIEQSNGEFLCFVDADDWVSTVYIENALKYIEEYKLDAVLGGTEKVYKNFRQQCTIEEKCGVLIYDQNIKELEAKILGNTSEKNSPLSNLFTSGPVAKIFKRTVIGDIRFHENLVIGEDTVFNLRVINKMERIGVVPDIWYYYRMNEFSATQKYNPNIMEYSERLIDVMTEMYYEDCFMRPYLCVRAIQQFYGMLLRGILNREAPLSVKEKKKLIGLSLEQERWSRLFEVNLCSDFAVSKLDRILKYLCRKKYISGIIIFVKIRSEAKKTLNDFRRR